MRSKGDVLILKDPGLNVRKDIQLWKDSKGNEHWILWNEVRKLYVNKTCEVRGVGFGFLTVEFNIEHEFDPSAKNKVAFYMPEEWFVSASETEQKCTCSIIALMTSGCKCGQINRERNVKI